MDGLPSSVLSGDGTRIALLTGGEGRPLLLVHGGTADLHRWEPVWPQLTSSYRVTAMDRRGRGGSGDAVPYDVEREFDDLAVVIEDLAASAGMDVDVVAHSYGAVCTLGAVTRGVPVRRVVLYEPPGKDTVNPQWLARAARLVEEGRLDEALESFLLDVIGRTPDDVQALRPTPIWQRRRAAVATLPREGAALEGLDLTGLAKRVEQPVLMLLGEASPPWAAAVTEPIAAALPSGRVQLLPGQGHMAIDTAPELFVGAVTAFLDAPG